MKKLTELVTSTEKPEHRAKRKAITFGSFKRAEDKEVQERKNKEHQAELTRIAEEGKFARYIADEEQRVIKEENTRKRSEFITGSLSNAFGTKTEVDFDSVREEVIDKYLPQLKEPEKEKRPTPFKSEPALNLELEEFKKKINEHLHTVGFMGSGGGGIGDIADAGDIDGGTALVDGKFLKYDSSSGKFVGADSSITDETLQDVIGAMFSSNTETDIQVTYQDADGTIDLVVSDISGNAGTATALETARTIGGVSFNGTANINLPGVNTAGNQNTSGTAATVTTAAQTNITSLGTLTALTVDNIVINGANIGHTSDTDAIAIASDGDVTLSQNLVVTGDFTVNGTTTTVSTTNMKVSDTLIELNTGATSNANDMGIIMERGSTGNNAIFMFDESADEFTVGTTTATNDATGNISITTGTFTAATLKGNLVVADDGNIGSASDTDAIAIASNGVVTFSQVPVFPNNTVESADIQADAVTGAKIADDAINSEHYTNGSIDTAHIADNQITPAKIAGEVNTQTGTSYTLVLADAFKIVTSSNGSAQTITIPPNSSVAFSVGDRIDIMMLGSGTTTVTGGSGVTLNGVSTGSGAISAQYVAASCIKLATNTWVLMGNHGGVS